MSSIKDEIVVLSKIGESEYLKNNTGVLYKITNIINGKCYIGQTTKSFIRRYGKNFETKNDHLQKSIIKYGKDNFIVELLYVGKNQEELNALEIENIKKFNSYLGGYNKTLGGEATSGWMPSKETRDKISKANTGNKFCLGRVLSCETKKKISNSHKNKKISGEHRASISNTLKGRAITKSHREKISNSLKGRKFSESHKEKLSQSLTGRTLSDETKLKVSIANKGENNPRSLDVICIIDGLKIRRRCLKDLVSYIQSEFEIRGVRDWFYRGVPKKYQSRISFVGTLEEYERTYGQAVA